MIDVYLDVDGVIIPVFDPAEGVKGSGWTDWRGQSLTHGRDEPVRSLTAYSPAMVARLTAFAEREDVTMHWCTTWGERADEELAPAIGLPTGWDVIDRDLRYLRAETGNVTIRSWWKRDAVQAHHAAHPDNAILWIDDDLGFDRDARQWLSDLHRAGEQVYAVTPTTTVGLSRGEMDRIDKFFDATRR